MFTIVVYSEILQGWALHGSSTFAHELGAENHAARNGYFKYAIIPFEDHNKFFKPNYKFKKVIVE